jgi:hypothetical protein
MALAYPDLSSPIVGKLLEFTVADRVQKKNSLIFYMLTLAWGLFRAKISYQHDEPPVYIRSMLPTQQGCL